jgi:hypothetical protein
MTRWYFGKEQVKHATALSSHWATGKNGEVVVDGPNGKAPRTSNGKRVPLSLSSWIGIDRRAHIAAALSSPISPYSLLFRRTIIDHPENPA